MTLYSLNLACPIPWPAHPAYPIAHDRKKGTSKGKGKSKQQEDAPAAMGSHLEDPPVHPDEEEEADEAFPDTFREYYWACLYATRSKEPSRRLVASFHARSSVHGMSQASSSSSWARAGAATSGLELLEQAESARAATELKASGSESRDDLDRIAQLQTALLDLGALDQKWSLDFRDLLDSWDEQARRAQHHELQLFSNAPAKAEGEDAMQLDGDDGGNLGGSAISADDTENGKEQDNDFAKLEARMQEITGAYAPAELDALKAAWTAWKEPAAPASGQPAPEKTGTSLLPEDSTDDGTAEPPATAANGTGHGNLHAGGGLTISGAPKNSREWLSHLQLAETKLQTIVALEILARLPPPPAPSKARRGRKISRSGAGLDWFAGLRGAPSSPAPASKKRARATAGDAPGTRGEGAVDEEPAVGQNGAESQSAESRRAVEKAYRKTATYLDQLTDSLAISQTVGGLDLDLLGLSEPEPSASTLSAGAGGDRGDAEPDAFQKFWVEVIEPEYGPRLPADIISGCASKFFTTSGSATLYAPHPSLAASDRDLSIAGATTSAPAPASPYYHPTPNLKALARSVAAAQLASDRAKIPNSPTLAKLLKASEDTRVPPALSVAHKAKARDGQEAGWLLPPPPAEDRGLLAIPDGAGSSSTGLRRPGSSVGGEPTGRNVFRSRQVQLGSLAGRISSMAGTGGLPGGPGSGAGKEKKPSAFMRTVSVSNLAAPSSGREASIPPAPRRPASRADSQDAATSDARSAIPPRAHAQSKRKPASPKKLDPRPEGRRTLVLATPSKSTERVRLKKPWQNGKATHTLATADFLDQLQLHRAPSQHDIHMQHYEHCGDVEEVDYVEQGARGRDMLVAETPRSERVLVAGTPGTGDILVGETPAR